MADSPTSSEDVKALCAERDIRFIRLWFTDILGQLKSFSVGVDELDDDFEGDLSDRLVDAIVAWGDEDTIRARIKAHWDAGANHVCLGPLSATPATMMDVNLDLVDVFAPGTW